MLHRQEEDAPAAGSDARATLQDVAELAGVSPITVSRALRTPGSLKRPVPGSKLPFSRRVTCLTSSRAASARVVAASSRAIVPSIDNSHYAGMLQGVSDELHRHNLELMVGVNGLSLAQEENLLRAFIGRRPEAWLFSGTEHTVGARAMLARAGIPVVETGALSSRIVDMNVGYSEERAVGGLIAFLHRCGYRRIGFICGPLDNNERAKRRRKGYLGAGAAPGAAGGPDRHAVSAGQGSQRRRRLRHPARALAGHRLRLLLERHLRRRAPSSNASGAAGRCRSGSASPAFSAWTSAAETVPPLTTKVPRDAA